LQRKAEKWVEKHPFFSGLVSVVAAVTVFFVAWQTLGVYVVQGYDLYLKQHCDPYVRQVVSLVEPHFTALFDLLNENKGFVGTLKGLFTPRPARTKEL
jgi:hypothetical protein|tara:strand:- start:7597 stop:7890 length:294 start_codon:yes stop_codon:yes gene_type:complete